ncbi:hypothetical protein QJQ45_029336 [Haematococcus lacustris]|nr:hypothetical protein QJQ45_029336 [Haematococcus lacustris]
MGQLRQAGLWKAMVGEDTDPTRCEHAYAWLLCNCKSHYVRLVVAAETAAAAWKALLADEQPDNYQLWEQLNNLQTQPGEGVGGGEVHNGNTEEGSAVSCGDMTWGKSSSGSAELFWGVRHHLSVLRVYGGRAYVPAQPAAIPAPLELVRAPAGGATGTTGAGSGGGTRAGSNTGAGSGAAGNGGGTVAESSVGAGSGAAGSGEAEGSVGTNSGAADAAGGEGSGAVNPMRQSSRLQILRSVAVAELPAEGPTIPATIEEARAGPQSEQWSLAADEMQSLLSYGPWVAAAEDMELEHSDVKTAFLNGRLKKVIYMHQPAGYEDGSGRVCRLHRALYGLRQAPRAWHARLKEELEQLGFTASAADSCLFTMMRGIKLGPVEQFLGMRISRDRAARQLVLSQEQYAMSVVDRYGLADSRPRAVTLSTTEQLQQGGGNHSFAEVIGSL